METRYNKKPAKKINRVAFSGYSVISCELKKRLGENGTLVVECYPGSNTHEIINGLSGIGFSKVILSEQAFLNKNAYERFLKEQEIITEDRVFAVMTTKTLEACFDEKKLAVLKKQAQKSKGRTLIIGVGAALISRGDLLVLADLARWEIQLRYRSGMSNMNRDNQNDPILAKYKQGFFFDWRVADKQKLALFEQMDYIMETNRENSPVMISAESFFYAMDKFSHEPFRTVPYFDPGVWGGQWMKQVCGLDQNSENYAWAFDGVPEENSILLDLDGAIMELPAMDITLTRARELLGDRVHARFGREFPIRFDFLDTMGGQNLSLQVHPLTEYISEKFNMRYTQDESYYMLDTGEDACVYIGVKSGIDKAEMISALKAAQEGGNAFDAEKYVNKIPVKKHDHILIPAGTVHCSGKNAMVLEISATPYIFTFKLWDWGRLGSDGLPRPIHIEYGEKNICFERDTKWVLENLVDRVETKEQAEGLLVEKTGLHEREFIETTRIKTAKPYTLCTNGSVNMLNLVEGEAAVISAIDNSFEDFEVHYAETFILPGSIEKYIISPQKGNKSGEITVIKAEVR